MNPRVDAFVKDGRGDNFRADVAACEKRQLSEDDAFAVLVVATASALSAVFAARKLADIDLVSALKALD